MVADKRAHSHPTSIEKTHRRGQKGKFVNMSLIVPTLCVGIQLVTLCVPVDADRPLMHSHAEHGNERGLNHFQPDFVLIEQLHQRWHRLLIGHQAVHQTDRPQANHGIAPKFA
jgi:hypothetical protein